MAKFIPLFSGSSGNCTYISGSDGAILIDAGVSAKRISESIYNAALDIKTIKAIFVTHEHSDHISGVRVLSSKLKIPVYATKGTYDALTDSNTINEKVEAYTLNNAVEAAGMLITPFTTSHDSRQSCGYIIETGERKMAVCTDLGYVSAEVRAAITGCDLVMIESNHDVTMLKNGPYPFFLKKRILGECGHLSNAACSDELSRLVQNGTTRLVLAHLSRENNMPNLALQTAKVSLKASGMNENADYIITVAPQVGGKVIAL